MTTNTGLCEPGGLNDSGLLLPTFGECNVGSGQTADEDEVTDVAVESEAGPSEVDKEFTEVNTE